MAPKHQISIKHDLCLHEAKAMKTHTYSCLLPHCNKKVFVTTSKTLKFPLHLTTKFVITAPYVRI